MKKTVLILALLALIGVGLVVFGTEDYVQTVALESVAEGTAPEASGVSHASAALRRDENLLLSIAYGDITLPTNENGTVLIPVIPESGITVTYENGATVTRSESVTAGEGCSFRSITFTVSKGSVYRTLTLTETHMAVAYLSVCEPDVGKGLEPFGDKKKRAEIVFLSADGTGGLLKETGTIEVKLRGNSSHDYAKKGYTLTNIDGNGLETARSFLGFPADTKFGLNSMYEDDTKLRDILSLELWQSILPEEKRPESIRMRYCELYINGFYRGLYGFQQTVTPAALGLREGDGLVKIVLNYNKRRALRSRTDAIEVLSDVPGLDLTADFLNAFALLQEGDPSGIAHFDADILFRYLIFLQVAGAYDNSFKNIAMSRRADTCLYSPIAYDTDQTFALCWDAADALFMAIRPELSMEDRLAGTLPLDGVLKMGPDVTRPLAELYFTLRESVLSAESLTGRARALFSLVTESGAMARDKTRWPDGYYTDSLDVVETFITERLAWCDNYFAAYLEDKAA